MNIIIKTPNFIGDTIMMLPAFELLKLEYPRANFTIICKASCIDIFREKGIKRFIIDDSRLKKNGRLKKSLLVLNEIRQERYDLGIIFRNTLVDALIFKLSKIETIIGYDNENRRVFLDFWLKIDRTRHYINHYAYLINSYLNNRYKTLPPMELNYQDSKLINKKDKKVVGFVLGGDNKGSRTYPKNLSLELFKLLKDKNIDIVLLGDKDDNQNNKIYEDYLKSIQIDINNLSGKTTIAEFIDAISSLDLLVTIDTSAMHIASATNTKFITLIGKGTSVFESVKPKVNFGKYLYRDNLDIDDNILISNIKPQLIRDTILEVLK